MLVEALMRENSGILRRKAVFTAPELREIKALAADFECHIHEKMIEISKK